MNTNDKKYTFNDLLEIMRVLRSDNGCPWDKAQDHQSIKYALLEEACEAMEALDKKGSDAFSDELGDVLLQVVFHSQIGSENDTFTIDDVLNKVCTKLISRHTHIFGTDKSNSSDNALDIWEKNKKKEKGLMTQTEIMRDVCSCLPQLIRAEKVQKKAAKVGFDWPDVSGAVDKMSEELEEVKAAMAGNGDVAEELGDLLFAVVNASRFLNVDAEMALHAASDKFATRFRRVEEEVLKSGRTMEEVSLAELDAIWNAIKHN